MHTEPPRRMCSGRPIHANTRMHMYGMHDRWAWALSAKHVVIDDVETKIYLLRSSHSRQADGIRVWICIRVGEYLDSVPSGWKSKWKHSSIEVCIQSIEKFVSVPHEWKMSTKCLQSNRRHVFSINFYSLLWFCLRSITNWNHNVICRLTVNITSETSQYVFCCFAQFFFLSLLLQ